MSSAIVLLLLLALLSANLPWLSERLFYAVTLKSGKHMGWRLLELVTLYFVLGSIAYVTEKKTMGQVATQHWEFYATTACLFLVLATPGFIYRYLWRR